MNSFLKIKALSLGAEITLIRREERKWLRNSRWLNKVSKGQTNNPLSADEAVKQRAHALDNFWGLRSHRLGLRLEARAANLAYAFIRGRTYAQAENKAYTRPNWSQVVRLVEKYGEAYKRQDVKALIERWHQ